MIDLWVEAKDIVSWFTGIVTARYSYLTGCDRYQLTPKVNKDKKLDDSCAFDENQLEIIGKWVSKHFTPKEEVKEVKPVRRTWWPAIYNVRWMKW